MKISLSLKVAIGTFFVAGVGVLLVSIISYSEMSDYVKKNLLDSLHSELKSDAKQIQKDIEAMKKDVRLLAQNEKIDAIYRAMKNRYNYDAKSNETLSSLKRELGKNFQSLLAHSDAYFNIRLIGANGDELVVSLKDSQGRVRTEKESALQNKGNREYFKEALLLNKDDIYVSKINLNKEHGVFSIPYIPTMRIALPVYQEGKIFAIVIINANVDKLFSILATKASSEEELYIANEDGYYIYHKDKGKTFGFDLGHGHKISDDFDLSRESYFEGSSAYAHQKLFIKEGKYIILALKTSDKFLKEQSWQLQKKLGFYIFFITIFIALFSLLLMRYLISPIVQLTQKAKKISSGESEVQIAFEVLDRNDEIGALSHSLQLMLERLENSKKEIEQKVLERTKELHELNENLEKIVQEKTQENIKQLETLQEQSKMASMGEMIGAIAHQWRQPLNEISISIQNLKYDYEDGLIDAEFIDAFIKKNKEIIKFMSSTIDDFRNFYRVDKTREVFDVREAIEKTLSLQMAQLTNNNISILISGESFEVEGYRNEFLQVILNIINNSKDALLAKGIENAKIEIELEGHSIFIRDNAGGIPESLIGRIFEPYFTTKEQGKGTGMGLYMSKMIIEENMQAKLSVRNIENGVEFRMDFNEKR